MPLGALKPSCRPWAARHAGTHRLHTITTRMRRFAHLYLQLDASTATGDKLAALRAYLQEAPAEDAAWAMYFLAGGRPRRVLPTALMRQVACRMAGIDDWLFEECYQAVGDLAETIAHLLPAPAPHEAAALPLSQWCSQRLPAWRALGPEAQAAALAQALAELGGDERFLLIKLIGGGFRVGVSKLLVQRALAEHAGLDAKQLAERMVGYTDARQPPRAAAFAALLQPAAQTGAARGALPYPFFLAHPLQDEVASLGPREHWLVEWKYDGIRAQLVRRGGAAQLWSRGEELISASFPEVLAQAQALPEGTVLDGELLVWDAGAEHPAPFARLQRRLNRKQVGRKLLQQEPVRLLAYDLLEEGGQDLRGLPQHERRQRLEAAVANAACPGIAVSPLLQEADWPALALRREEARERAVEGLMLKHRDSRYGSGRSKSEGSWWKWKVQALTIDGVLIYAQAGHGRRASLYTDYTFALWNRPPASAEEAQAVVEAIVRREPPQPGALQLVPFAKAYSGLTDAEFEQVSRVVRATTLEKFGPVRSVRPTLVFELAFEAVQASRRHKSGVAVRFPRMLRMRSDKLVHEADTLPTLLALAPQTGGG